MARDLKYRNRHVALVSFFAAASMVGASFAAVPLYEVFCQVTGYGGTTQTAEAAPGTVLKRKKWPSGSMRMSTRRCLGNSQPRRTRWRFGSASALAFYRARNLSAWPIVGTATFNVTPLKAGQYFHKIECFCFTEQRLEAGDEIDMPVSFFVDPAIADDPNLNDVREITLSYTFFQTEADPDRTAWAGDVSSKTDG